MHMRVMINIYFRIFGKTKDIFSRLVLLFIFLIFSYSKKQRMFWSFRNIPPKRLKGLSLRTILTLLSSFRCRILFGGRRGSYYNVISEVFSFQLLPLVANPNVFWVIGERFFFCLFLNDRFRSFCGSSEFYGFKKIDNEA